MYCTVLFCAVLNCTALYCTALHCIALYCTVLCCTILQCTSRHNQFGIVPPSVLQQYKHIVLHCTALNWITLHYMEILYCYALHENTVLHTALSQSQIFLIVKVLKFYMRTCHKYLTIPMWYSDTQLKVTFINSTSQNFSVEWLAGQGDQTCSLVVINVVALKQTCKKWQEVMGEIVWLLGNVAA